jgi:hypothetical protein
MFFTFLIFSLIALFCSDSSVKVTYFPALNQAYTWLGIVYVIFSSIYDVSFFPDVGIFLSEMVLFMSFSSRVYFSLFFSFCFQPVPVSFNLKMKDWENVHLSERTSLSSKLLWLRKFESFFCILFVIVISYQFSFSSFWSSMIIPAFIGDPYLFLLGTKYRLYFSYSLCFCNTHPVILCLINLFVGLCVVYFVSFNYIGSCIRLVVDLWNIIFRMVAFQWNIIGQRLCFWKSFVKTGLGRFFIGYKSFHLLRLLYFIRILAISTYGVFVAKLKACILIWSDCENIGDSILCLLEGTHKIVLSSLICFVLSERSLNGK